MVELVVEAKWWEECCTGVSTRVEVHSTEVVAGHVSETNEKKVEYSMDPMKACEQTGLGYNKFELSLASPAGKV